MKLGGPLRLLASRLTMDGAWVGTRAERDFFAV